MRYRQGIALLLLLSLLLTLLPVASVHAAGIELSVQYGGMDFVNGNSIHYNGDTVTVTVTASVSVYHLTMSGTNVSVNEEVGGTVSPSHDFTLPSGPIQITATKGSLSGVITVNMYKNTPISGGAGLSYYSYRMEVKKIGDDLLSDPYPILAYDGINDTGVNTDQMNALLKSRASTPSNYHVIGTIWVNVFLNGVWQGGYETEYGYMRETGPGLGNLYDYSWGGITAELQQRSEWGFDYLYNPQATVTVRYLDVDTLADLPGHPAKTLTGIAWNTFVTESKIDDANYTYDGSLSGNTASLDAAQRTAAVSQTWTFNNVQYQAGYINFYYKTKNRSLNIMSPTNGAQYYVNETIPITGNGSYNSSIQAVVDGSNYGAAQPQDSSSANNSYTSSISHSTAGGHTVKLVNPVDGNESTLVHYAVIERPSYTYGITMILKSYGLDAELSRYDVAEVQGSQVISAPDRPSDTFLGSYVVYNESQMSKSNMQSGVRNQTITLSESNTHAYMVCYYQVGSKPVPAYRLGGTSVTVSNNPTIVTIRNDLTALQCQSTATGSTIAGEYITIRSGTAAILRLRWDKRTDGRWDFTYTSSTGMFMIGSPNNSVLDAPSVNLTPLQKGTVTVEGSATDANGNDSEDIARSTWQIVESPPSTAITPPSTVWPQQITAAGGPGNVATWDYSQPNNVPYLKSYVKLTAKGPQGAENNVILEQEQAARSVGISGNKGDKFLLEVRVYANDADQTPSTTVSAEITVMDPYPAIKVTAADLAYLSTNLAVAVDISRQPPVESVLEQYIPTTYTTWKIIEKISKTVIMEKQEGDGTTLPASLYLDPDKFVGQKYYTMYQYGVNGIGNEGYGTATFYVDAAPTPTITLPSKATYINETVYYSDVSIVQPDPGSGAPYVPQTFNASNCRYTIVKPGYLNPDGTVAPGGILLEADGILSGLEVTRANGYLDSTTQAYNYKVIQTARNSYGVTGKAISDLTMNKTPTPFLSVVMPDDYMGNPLTVGYMIQDIFYTTYTAANTRYKVEKLDANLEAVSVVASGSGIPASITPNSPDYAEDTTYRLTLYATNKKDIEGSGSDNFTIFAPPAPTVIVNITDRDGDLSTPRDKIFTKESLQFVTSIVDYHFAITATSWEIQDSSYVTVMNGSGTLDGTRSMDLPAGDYRAVQYARNDRNKVGQGETMFRVNNPEPPILTVSAENRTEGRSLDPVDFTINTVYLNNTVDISTGVSEVNVSEQHRNGYALHNTWSIRDKANGQVAGGYASDGIGNMSVAVDGGTFTQGHTYVFRQASVNAEFPEIGETREMEFTVGNKKPEIELAAVLGDRTVPLYSGEEITINITGTDADGTIETVAFYVDGGDYAARPYFVLNGSPVTSGLHTANYGATLHYTPKAGGNVTFQVAMTDNYGDTGIREITFIITGVNITTDMKLQTYVDGLLKTDISQMQLKQNRYFETDLADSTTSAVWPLDFRQVQLEYRTDSGAWASVPDLQSYGDDYIEVYYPQYPDKKLVSFYFKQADVYTLYAKVPDTAGNQGAFSSLRMYIVEDQAPAAQFTILSPQARITEDYITSFASLSGVVVPENVGRSFLKFTDMGVSPDNDTFSRKEISIVYDWNMDGAADDAVYTVTITQSDAGIAPGTEIVVPTNANSTVTVRDLSNYKLTFLTGVGELGDYYIGITSKEKIVQLPASQDNPLYQKLKAQEKSAASDASKVTIDNNAPTLSFEVEPTKNINLIVQFDYDPTAEERQTIEDIINQLQQNGIKVNVIRKYNQY